MVAKLLKINMTAKIGSRAFVIEKQNEFSTKWSELKKIDHRIGAICIHLLRIIAYLLQRLFGAVRSYHSIVEIKKREINNILGPDYRERINTFTLFVDKTEIGSQYLAEWRDLMTGKMSAVFEKQVELGARAHFGDLKRFSGWIKQVQECVGQYKRVTTSQEELGASFLLYVQERVLNEVKNALSIVDGWQTQANKFAGDQKSVLASFKNTQGYRKALTELRDSVEKPFPAHLEVRENAASLHKKMEEFKLWRDSIQIQDSYEKSKSAIQGELIRMEIHLQNLSQELANKDKYPLLDESARKRILKRVEDKYKKDVGEDLSIKTRLEKKLFTYLKLSNNGARIPLNEKQATRGHALFSAKVESLGYEAGLIGRIVAVEYWSAILDEHAQAIQHRVSGSQKAASFNENKTECLALIDQLAKQMKECERIRRQIDQQTKEWIDRLPFAPLIDCSVAIVNNPKDVTGVKKDAKARLLGVWAREMTRWSQEGAKRDQKLQDGKIALSNFEESLQKGKEAAADQKYIKDVCSKYSLKHVKVPADGNCLFSSCLEGLKQLKDLPRTPPKTADLFREELVKYLEDLQNYTDFYDAFSGQILEAFHATIQMHGSPAQEAHLSNLPKAIKEDFLDQIKNEKKLKDQLEAMTKDKLDATTLTNIKKQWELSPKGIPALLPSTFDQTTKDSIADLIQEAVNLEDKKKSWVKTYLDGMKVSKAYAGSAELQVISKMFNVKIALYSNATGDKPQIFGEELNNPAGTINLIRPKNTPHFDCLLPNAPKSVVLAKKPSSPGEKPQKV